MVANDILDTKAELVGHDFTGITRRVGPRKAYIVWWDGAVVHFCATAQEARMVLANVPAGREARKRGK